MIPNPNPSTLSAPPHVVRIDPRGRVFVDDVQTGRLPMTPSRLLRAILAHSTVATKDYLLSAVYAGADEPEVKIMDVWVCKIRRQLGEHGAAAIETVWGRGYARGDGYSLARDPDTTTIEVDAGLLAEVAYGASAPADEIVTRLLQDERDRQWGRAPRPHDMQTAS